MLGVGDHQVALHGQSEGHQDGEGEEHLGERQSDWDDVRRDGDHLGEGEEAEGDDDGDGVGDEESGEELGEGEGEAQLGPDEDPRRDEVSW